MAKAKKSKDPKETIEKDAAAASVGGVPKKKGIDVQAGLLTFAFLACCLAFLPTSLLLFFGFMPTFAALVIDPTPDKIKTMAVGAMNLAGVVPFLLQLWTSGNAQNIETAFHIVAEPETLITMYGTAAVGYVIFYGISGIVAALLLQQGKSRLEEVRKRIMELERKWGREVTGIGGLEPEEHEDYFGTENR